MRHLLILILTTALCAAQSADTKKAQSLMQAAQAKETIGGDLKGAIELYRQAAKAARADRAIGVQAMLKVAECQERQGLAEARKTYEEIVRNYGDQKVAVETARKKLGVTASTETRARLLWDDAIDTWGRATADGRYLSFVDWSTGDLAIRDLTTGENRRLTNKGGYAVAEGEAGRNSISPDGKRVAFAWQSWNAKAKSTKVEFSLRVVDADGKNERVLREYADSAYVEPLGWSPDGRWLLAISEKHGKEPVRFLGRVNVETGEWKELTAASGVWKNQALYSPDGKWLASAESGAPTAPAGAIKVASAAGAGGSETEIASTGHLLGWLPDGSGIVYCKKFGEATKSYIQRIADGRPNGAPHELPPHSIGDADPLAITEKGDLIYSLSNVQLEGRILRLAGENGLQDVPETSFPLAVVGNYNNLGNLRFSPDGKSIASSPRMPVISILNMETRAGYVISPRWHELTRFEWAPDGKSILATAAGSDKVPGLFRVDVATGNPSFVCKMEGGRPFVPAADGLSIFLLTQSGLERIRLDNCQAETVWSRDLSGQGPMNIRLSKDRTRLLIQTFRLAGVYEIGSRSWREIFVRTQNTEGFSTWSGDWSADGERIFFTAREDSGGTRGGEIQIYNANGGEPKRQAVPEFARSMSLSPDGVHAAVAYRKVHGQVWVLENFLPAK